MAGEGPWILALDFGTSSARGVFFDGTGTAPAGGPVLRRSYPWRTTADGAMETDADLLLHAAYELLDEATAEIRRSGREVAAVAMTAFWHGLVGIQGDHSPATPLFAWGDVRPSAAAARLRERLDAVALHRRTGCFVDASYPAARLLWLREARADIFPRVPHWMSFAEYLGLRLFGERRCTYSMASGTGLLDGERLEWDEEVLDAVGIRREALSPLVDAEPYRSPIAVEYRRRWPELASVPWFPAVGDGASANLGSGAIGAARPALTIGTTAAVRVLVAADRPPWNPELWSYRLDARRFVVGRALSNGGNVVAALERTLKLPPVAERETLLAGMPADGHGLTVLPWLVGERGPGRQPGAGATVVGQTQATSPIELLQAWLEAVALRIGRIVDVTTDTLGEPRVVVAGGGALNASPAWCRIVADVLGRPLALAAAPETSARGAALLVLEHIGAIPDAAAIGCALHEAVRPDDERHRRYRAATLRQQRLAAHTGYADPARAMQPAGPAGP
jgi:gluconokinase